MLRHLPDTELFDPNRRSIHGHTVLQWLPAPCIQDMNFDHAAGLQSRLEGQRSDERTGLKRLGVARSEAVKRVFRPAYTRLYSSALAPSGRMRRAVPFG